MGAQRPITATVRLNTMFCEKKNDDLTDDSIYALVAGVKSDGSIISKILPSSDGRFSEWSFTDHGHTEQYLDPRFTRPDGILNRPKPFSGELANGEEVYLNIIFMEKDGSNDSDRFDQLAAAIRTASQNNPEVEIYTFASQIILKNILSFNSDDVIGSLFVTLRNENGNLVTEWSEGENAEYIGIGEHNWGYKYRFYPSGGGFSYYAYWSVRQGDPESDTDDGAAVFIMKEHIGH